MKVSRVGFTLVELLVTVFILAIGLGTVFALLTMTARSARETALEARRERFVSTVFASVDCYASQTPGSTQPVWELPVVTESGLQLQEVVPDDTERLWPALEGASPIIPRLTYQLTLVTETNSLDRLEASLSVRFEGELQGREYQRVFRINEPIL